MSFSKGQTQAVTAVLLTGVIVGSIGAVYYWGSPILEKRQAEGDVKAVEEDVENLYSETLSVSQQGSGSSSTAAVDVNGRINVNATHDYIQISSEFQKPVYGSLTWSLYQGTGFKNLTFGAGSYGIKGTESPGVIGIKSSSTEGSSTVIYRVEFRNMCDPATGQLEKVDLEASGQTRAAGSTQLRLVNQGEETDSVSIGEGECESNGKVEREKSVVEVQIQ